MFLFDPVRRNPMPYGWVNLGDLTRKPGIKRAWFFEQGVIAIRFGIVALDYCPFSERTIFWFYGI